MTDPDEKKEIIQTIGVWALRVLLLAGAVALAAVGKKEEAGWCVSALTLSFFLL